MKWAEAKKGNRVKNQQTGWTGVLVRDPILKGRGNNTARILWDQNGHEGTISLNNTQIVPLEDEHDYERELEMRHQGEEDEAAE